MDEIIGIAATELYPGVQFLKTKSSEKGNIQLPATVENLFSQKGLSVSYLKSFLTTKKDELREQVLRNEVNLFFTELLKSNTLIKEFFIPKEQFEKYEKAYSLSFPPEIKFFYGRIGIDKPDEFYRTLIDDKNLKFAQKATKVQIEEEFASAILSKFETLTVSQREKIETDIRNSEILCEYRDYGDSLLDFLLVEGLLFDEKNNRFILPFLQEAYEEKQSDRLLVKAIFEVWSHCGGWGGLITSGKGEGFEGGGVHAEYRQVKYNGKSYDYNSNVFPHKRHYLSEYLKAFAAENKDWMKADTGNFYI